VSSFVLGAESKGPRNRSQFVEPFKKIALHMRRTSAVKIVNLCVKWAMAHIQASALISASRTQVYDYMAKPENLAASFLGKLDVELKRSAENMTRGSEYQFEMTRFGLSQLVTFSVEETLRGVRLSVRQKEGLFADWHQTTRFEEHGPEHTLVTEFIEYKLPFGLLGFVADDLVLRKDLTELIQYRLDRIKEILGRG
jgi:ligand-binding SRPBCC domain-containing protein